MSPPRDLGQPAVECLLCDADGTLFASEEPAYDASVGVTNRCLERLGIDRRFTATELRLNGTGKNFRSTITELAELHGVAVERDEFRAAVDRWVAEENEAVTNHLAEVLSPNTEVSTSLARLSQQYQLAVVSSSALSRVNVCLERTDISTFFAPQRRFSAQDSLPVATSKPDPAIYRFAGQELQVGPGQAVAIEDAVAGAESAVRAGFPTIGIVCFVPLPERAQRIRDLTEVGVMDVVTSWSALERLLANPQRTTLAAENTTTTKVHL